MTNTAESRDQSRLEATARKQAKRAVIIQSNYVPWKGYFDLISQADVVVLLDTVQSTKNDWRNRNQIKTQAGKLWISIPIRHSSSLRINEVQVADRAWARKHLQSITQAYAHAPHAAHWFPKLKDWYGDAAECGHLSEINRLFIYRIANFLEIGSEFHEAESVLSYPEHDAMDPTRRLVEICKRVGATTYLSGPAAKSYLDETSFAAESIAVEWFDYSGYPPYQQLHGQFDPAVSILDLILMTGPNARQYAFKTQLPTNNGVFQ